MSQVYIALGTNLGDRAANLSNAIERMASSVRVQRRSPIYVTEPWGITDQPAFLNQALVGETKLAPHDLLRFLKGIEASMGRGVNDRRYGPRLIDLDIVLYDQIVLTSYSLTIPHPRLIERAFVLAPLAALAPDLRHPTLGCTLAELLNRLDTTGVAPMLWAPS